VVQRQQAWYFRVLLHLDKLLCSAVVFHLATSPEVEGACYFPRDVSGADLGGFVGFERTPLFVDSFDLLVLCYSQQCLTLSTGVPVQFDYRIIFSMQFNSTCSEVICSIFLRVELASA